MQKCLRLTIVVGLVLSGFSHAFCACGCAESEGQKSVQVCHRCGSDRSQQAPQQPKPCKCRPCQVVDAVPPDSAASVFSPDSTSGVSFAPVGPAVRFTVFRPSETLVVPGPPRASPPPHCRLPILLEHLLF